MSKPEQKACFTVPVDIYRCDVYFLAGTYDDLLKKLKDLDLPQKMAPTRTEASKYQALTMDCNNGNVIIWFPGETYPGTIVHECTHAANMILEYHDVVDGGNHEALAYLAEYLFDSIMEGLLPEQRKPEKRQKESK